MRINLMIILGIILATASTIVIVKNYLISRYIHDSGFMNVIPLLLLVISLVCSLVITWDGFHLQDVTEYMKVTADMPIDLQNQLKQEIAQRTREITTSLIIGYVAFMLSAFIRRNAYRQIQAEYAVPKKKWDWNKIEGK